MFKPTVTLNNCTMSLSPWSSPLSHQGLYPCVGYLNENTLGVKAEWGMRLGVHSRSMCSNVLLLWLTVAIKVIHLMRYFNEVPNAHERTLKSEVTEAHVATNHLDNDNWPVIFYKSQMLVNVSCDILFERYLMMSLIQ